MSKPTSASFNLEKSLQQLETIVEKMESGDLTLDQSLKEFEKGVKLTQQCQQALTTAEKKVQIVIDDKLQPFDEDFT